MKKILEVLQYGDTEIRFNTDIKNFGESVQLLAPLLAFNMSTRLWGGNEVTILNIIRMLAAADLSLCVDRDNVLRDLEDNSVALSTILDDARKEFERQGGQVIVFRPECKQPGNRRQR